MIQHLIEHLLPTRSLPTHSAFCPPCFIVFPLMFFTDIESGFLYIWQFLSCSCMEYWHFYHHVANLPSALPGAHGRPPGGTRTAWGRPLAAPVPRWKGLHAALKKIEKYRLGSSRVRNRSRHEQICILAY